MKIYFTGSVRGGRGDADTYLEIVKYLRKYGTILTEHVADPNLTSQGEPNKTDKEIHDRDLNWVEESDVMVAEVSTPSLGVGYEISKAEDLGKPVLCLYRLQEGKSLSAMIAGSENLSTMTYKTLDDIFKHVDNFFSSLGIFPQKSF